MNSLLYRAAFRAAGNVGRCRLEDTIVIAGSPRSGTTLVEEVFRALPGYKALNEPLLYEHTQKKHGFEPRTFIMPGQMTAQQRAFIRDTLTGRLGPGVRWSFPTDSAAGRIRLHATRRKLVVKFCRINRMLQCVASAFPTRGIVFVVRHPCSVISSMIKFGPWSNSFEMIRDRPNSAVRVHHLPAPLRERFEPIANRITTRLEQLALLWCLDHYIPFFHHHDHPWILAPYERLVLHGVDELRRLTSALGVPLTDEMAALLHKPSSSAKGVAPDPRAQLSKWKHSLTREQIDTIMTIVREAGLGELYTEDPEPNYERLNRLQIPAYAWRADGAVSSSVATAP